MCKGILIDLFSVQTLAKHFIYEMTLFCQKLTTLNSMISLHNCLNKVSSMN